jgi:hypothetical protein
MHPLRPGAVGTAGCSRHVHTLDPRTAVYTAWGTGPPPARWLGEAGSSLLDPDTRAPVVGVALAGDHTDGAGDTASHTLGLPPALLTSRGPVDG